LAWALDVSGKSYLQHKTISTNEIRECLERSGYLLESLIVRELSDRGYFVEPNQVVLDPRTGKSRELDIVAEHYSYQPDHRGTCVKTHFVAEVINNKYPVVLLTKRPSTPNSNFESYVKFGCTPEPNDFYKHFDIYDDRSPPQERLFSQYCALSTKKGEAKELMASHPEDMYSSLQKVAEYVEHEVGQFADFFVEPSGDIWRLFFWHPMLVLGGQLVVVEDSEAGIVSLSEAASAFLEFNWHQDGELRTTVIEVITIAALYDRMETIVLSDQALEAKLHAIHAKTVELKA
jgi:hypothetical protein